ncbi:hypothetical protein BS78_03G207600 [Paspalum vaginatum]|nr:hypothetical protein BS78_03G207600 [Paspalum vaginatum]
MRETSLEDSRSPGGRRGEPTVVAKEAAPEDEESSDGEFEFEFPSVSRDPAASAAADELFAGGRVQAFYPLFGRVLDEEPRPFQLEQARTSSVASTSSSSSSTSTGDAVLGSASPDSYCLWAPGPSSPASSPARAPRKSGSTGSVPRWRRVGELLAGRSRSDGKDRLLFLSPPPSPARDSAKQRPPPPKGKGSSKAAAAATELDAVAAGRRMSGGYGYGGNNKASNGGRRTFLPYRQDLVGLFASVHGLSRSPHPF